MTLKPQAFKPMQWAAIFVRAVAEEHWMLSIHVAGLLGEPPGVP